MSLLFQKVEDAVALAMARQRRSNFMKSGEVVIGFQLTTYCCKTCWEIEGCNTQNEI